MNIKSIVHSSYATSVNCYSGKCRPGPSRTTIIKENIDVKVEVGSGITIDVRLSNEETEYLKQIVFARAKEKIAALNIIVDDH